MTGTSPPDRLARRPRGGRGAWWPVAAVATTLGIAGLVLAAIRPWGDTSTSGGRLSTDTPVVVAVLLVVALVCATVTIVWTASRPRGTGAGRWSQRVLLVVSLGAAVAALLATIDVIDHQISPRDGGLFALLTATATLVAVVAAALDAAFTPHGSTRWIVAGVGLLVVVALVAIAAVVAPRWPSHRLTARYQDGFSEGALPASPSQVGWRYEPPDGTDVVGVIGGQIITITPAAGRAAEAGGGGCGVTVTALDPATSHVDWTVRRPLRCDGPAIETVDGNSQVVRLRFGADQPTSVRDIYYATESGHELFPAASADKVTQWTEGFGLVIVPGAATVQGIAPTTGAVAWTRDIPPDCAVDRQAISIYATPVDGQQPPGALPVVQAGDRIVLGDRCSAGGRTSRHAWLIDTAGGPANDHRVEVPGGGLSGPTAATGPAGFAAGLDTVVVTVPTTTAHEFQLVGIALDSGEVRWREIPLLISRLDRTVAGQVVLSSLAGPAGASPSPFTAVVDDRDGTLSSGHDDPAWTGASVELVGGQLILSDPTSGWTAVMRDPVSGTTKTSIPLPNCIPAGTPNGDVGTTGTAATTPLVAAPGSIVVRCQGRNGETDTLVGLT